MVVQLFGRAWHGGGWAPLALSALLLVAWLQPEAAPATSPPRTLLPAYAATPTPISALGLIDAHNHLPSGVTLDNLVQLMDEANVAKTVLMTVYYTGQGITDENLVVEFYKKRPDRIIPFVGMQRGSLLDVARWLNPDERAENLLRFAESRLQTGYFRGMGEFILWHYPYLFAGGQFGGTEAIKIPADTPLMKRFLDLAAKYYVPVNIHYEIDDESLPSLRRMLDYGRQATIILAHNCGRPDPATLKALLDEYPNVYCDWGGMNRWGGYGLTSPPPAGLLWFVKNPLDDGTGHLRPEWKAFYEQYADRIVGVGPDIAHPETWAAAGYYKRTSDTFRTLLSDLSPEAAEKIGFKNAQKLLEPIPLVDAHDHVAPGLALETIIGPLMDQAGVTKIILMANEVPADWPVGAEDKLTLDVCEKYPRRVIPFLTSLRWGLAIRDRAWLEYADRQLATGKFRGLGQFIVKRYASHDPSVPGWDASIGVPLDSTWAQDLMRLGAKHNVPILFTMETTPESLLALDRALEQNPNTKLIWAHQNPLKERIGSTPEERARLGDPQQIATLLEKHPNLFADLTIGRDWQIVTDGDWQIPANWRNLYEKYNDRFVVGIDKDTREAYESGYVFEAFWIRRWLAQLSEDTRQKLAYENIYYRILAAKPVYLPVITKDYQR